MTGAERNRVRQENTLWVLRAEGWITSEEYDTAIAQEMVFKYGIEEEDLTFECEDENCDYSGEKGTYLFIDGTYCCPECGTELTMDSDDVYSWFVETVLDDVAKALAEQNGWEWNDKTRETCMNLIKRGGYHIYTTLDMDVQNQVDEIYTDLNEIPEARSRQQLQSAIVVVDKRSGDIVAIAGGVSANKPLREALEAACIKNGYDFCRPEFIFCTDNAAMIACAAYYEYEQGESADLSLNANPNLTL